MRACLMVIAATVAFAGSAQAGSYIAVGGDRSSIDFLDASTIAADGSFLKVWVVDLDYETRKIEEKSYDYALVEYDLDCASRRYQTKQGQFYNLAHEPQTGGPLFGAWQDAVPDSMGATLLDQVCRPDTRSKTINKSLDELVTTVRDLHRRGIAPFK